MSLFRYEGSQSATVDLLPQTDLNHKDIYNTTGVRVNWQGPVKSFYLVSTCPVNILMDSNISAVIIMG